ncbi:MAG TPA: tetratricopeptide repeat protein [Chitinophagaceae bacterium]|nr:tetratricopeptide repeat protein [Chitinophagaceae bacterium]
MKRLLDESIRHADEAISLSDKLNFQNGRINGRIARANSLIFASRIEEATATMNEAISLTNVNKDYIGLGNSYIILAKIYTNTGNLDSIEIAAELAIKAADVSKDNFVVTKALNFIGIAEQGRGEYAKAIETLLKCLRLSEQIKDSITAGSCLGNIANVHSSMKNNREALKYFFMSLEQKKHNGLFREAAISYSNIGSTYRSMDIFDSAKYNYYQAYAIASELNSNFLLATIANNLADVFEAENNLDSSLYYNKIAFEKNTLLKNQTTIILNLYQTGTLYMKMAEAKNDNSFYRKAIDNFNEGLHIAQEIKDKQATVKGYRYLSMANEKLNQFKESLKYLDLSYNLNDSIKNDKFTAEIAEMQTKYETEKKEIEITKLNAAKLLDAEKIARQRTLNYSLLAIAVLILISGFLVFRNIRKKRAAEQQVAILERQNAIESMRSKIAGDVHDDMGANLTRLGLNAQQLLMSTAIPESEKKLAEKISLQSKDVITGMREIIWASNPANDNLKSMLSFMRQYIDRFFDGTNIRTVVNFPHDAGEITLHPEVRRNLFLILKESLNNAVKYSGTDKVDIDFHHENEHYGFNIKDYGKGIDESSKDDLSNGLRNMEMRAAQIQSLFKLVTAPGKGVEIAITGKLY